MHETADGSYLFCFGVEKVTGPILRSIVDCFSLNTKRGNVMPRQVFCRIRCASSERAEDGFESSSHRIALAGATQ